MGEISFKNIFIDGTKIEANANRYTFVWAKAVEKNLQKLMIKINQELALLCEKYGLADASNLEEVIEFLSTSIRLLNIEFVHGRGKPSLPDHFREISYKAKKEDGIFIHPQNRCVFFQQIFNILNFNRS